MNEGASYSTGFRLREKSIEAIIYFPVINEKDFFHSKITNDRPLFKQTADIIVNRITDGLSDALDKIYTRDIFGKG